jgi:stearoyl-CoA desaturase (delta-9 desaturase)
MINLFQASSTTVRYAHILARIGVIFGAFFITFDLTLVLTSIIAYYILLTIGISIMMHRYFSHKSFEFKNNIIRKFFIIISLLSLRGSPIAWAYLHRAHHEHVDTKNDPHTPVGRKFNFFGLLDENNKSNEIKIFKIRSMMTKEHLFINQYYWLILGLILAPVAFINFTFFYYAWLIPVVLVQFSINLQNFLGHMPGFGAYRTYNNSTSGNSQNSLLLWPLYLGEAWHNNHHAHARHYHYGKAISGKWWEIDPGASLIEILKK